MVSNPQRRQRYRHPFAPTGTVPKTKLQMKIDFKTWALIILAAAFALYVIFDKNPEPQADKIQALETALAISDVEKKEKDVIITNLKTKIAQDSIISAQDAIKFKTEVSSSKREIARLRANPVVVQVLQDVPEVDSLVSAQADLIARQDVYIDTLQNDLRELQVNMNQLVENFEGQIKLYQEDFQNMKALADVYKKDLRRERRKVKLIKVVAVIGTVGAFILGNK